MNFHAKPWLVILGKLLLGVALALVTLELIGRHVSFTRPAHDGQGWGLFQPGTTFRCNNEGHGNGYWNTQGIRRPELFQPGDPEPILVMGDSLARDFFSF